MTAEDAKDFFGNHPHRLLRHAIQNEVFPEKAGND
jgi:hypothetical protein